MTAAERKTFANESLHHRFQNDPQFAAAMEAKYLGILQPDGRFVPPDAR